MMGVLKVVVLIILMINQMLLLLLEILLITNLVVIILQQIVILTTLIVELFQIVQPPIVRVILHIVKLRVIQLLPIPLIHKQTMV